MVMERLGPSLEELLVACKRQLSLKTVLLIAEQLLLRTEAMHSRGFVHRDVKAENFLLGWTSTSRRLVHIIDFGLARPWQNSKTKEHIPYQEGKKLVGTARFASVNTHLGIQQTRRDDLEAVGYLLIYLRRGRLPWQGVGAADGDVQKYERIMDMKMSMKPEEICKGEPAQFATYLKYCRSLGFEDRPDYAQMRKLFKDLLLHQKGVGTCDVAASLPFDWETQRPSELAPSALSPRIKTKLESGAAEVTTMTTTTTKLGSGAAEGDPGKAEASSTRSSSSTRGKTRKRSRGSGKSGKERRHSADRRGPICSQQGWAKKFVNMFKQLCYYQK
ncbi:unnamed protein product [Polarella glacialis]|uniref:Casein kinase I n=1 Tax=Polarella glacialis TaxID=89957 RepID=A0A813FQB8_POLGL|nr:unnamed protein product [Polarella glacialis]